MTTLTLNKTKFVNKGGQAVQAPPTGAAVDKRKREMQPNGAPPSKKTFKNSGGMLFLDGTCIRITTDGGVDVTGRADVMQAEIKISTDDGRLIYVRKHHIATVEVLPDQVSDEDILQ